MGQDPSTIRKDIEETRERMGDTVDALAYKSDVKARAKDSVSDKVDAVKSMITGAGDSVSEATPSTGEVKQTAREAVGVAQENPLGLAIGAAAVGFLAGMMIPSTSLENRKLGPVADQVKEHARDAAQTVVEEGGEAARDAAQAALSAAKDTGRQHAEEAKADLQDQAQQAKDPIGSSSWRRVRAHSPPSAATALPRARPSWAGLGGAARSSAPSRSSSRTT